MNVETSSSIGGAPPPGATAAGQAADVGALTKTRGVPIELLEVTKVYPGQSEPAVNKVSLRIEAGEIVCLVGPSGCGKTTTMKLINRLIEPSSGTIMIGDTDVRSAQPDTLRRGIGYVIQQGGLFPHLTIAQNIAIVPRMLGWSKVDTSERIDRMLELVGLEPGDYRDRRPTQLSGGQQQRVGVARALAADPPVLLMDEPFGAVDPITRQRLQDELLQLQAELSKTIVFVTHDFDEALKLGDRIVILAQGSRIVQYAPPDEILAQPADDFVRGFIGSDRAVKLLRITQIEDVNLDRFVLAHSTDDAATVHQQLVKAQEMWALVVDKQHRPNRWVKADELADATGAISDYGQPVGQTISSRATLQEALETLLAADAEFVPVVKRGRHLGLISLSTVQAAISEIRQRARHDA